MKLGNHYWIFCRWSPIRLLAPTSTSSHDTISTGRNGPIGGHVGYKRKAFPKLEKVGHEKEKVKREPVGDQSGAVELEAAEKETEGNNFLLHNMC